MLTLHYSPGACSLASHIALEEAGATYEAIWINFAEGQQQSPEFLRINPHGRVPALVTGDRVVTESIAILGYVADLFGAPGSIPRGDPLASARTMELLSWLSGTVHTGGFGALFRPARFTADQSLHPGLMAGAREVLAGHFAEIEQLAGDGWLAGGDFTAADSYAAIFYRWAIRARFDLATYPRWKALTGRVIARPAVARALATEGLSPGEFD